MVDGYRIKPAPAPDADARFEIVADWDATTSVGAAGAPEALAAFAAACAHIGVEVIELPDTPGLAVTRTVAMIVAMAREAETAGVADRAGIDAALRLGVSHPRGPFEWAATLGDEAISALIGMLATDDAVRYGTVGR